MTVTRVGAERVAADRLEPVAVEHHPTPADAVTAGCDWPVTTELDDRAGLAVGLLRGHARGPRRPRPARARPASSWCGPRRVRPAGCCSPSPRTPGTPTTTSAAPTPTPARPVRVSFERPMAAGLLEKPPGAGRRVAVTNPPDPSPDDPRRLPDPQRPHRVGRAAPAGRTTRSRSSPGPSAPATRSTSRPAPTSTSTPRSSTAAGCSSASATTSTGRRRSATPSSGTSPAAATSRSCRGTRATGRSASSDGGATMIAYKQRFEDDPVFGTDDAATTTTLWAHPVTGRPEAALTGVSFTRGGYSRASVRGCRAAPVATPCTGPTTGSSPGPASSTATCSAPHATVVGYECDGCDFTMVDGLPVPTGVGGTPRRSRSSRPHRRPRSTARRACDRCATATAPSSSSTRSACSATTRPRPRPSSRPVTRCSAPTGTRAAAPSSRRGAPTGRTGSWPATPTSSRSRAPCWRSSVTDATDRALAARRLRAPDTSRPPDRPPPPADPGRRRRSRLPRGHGFARRLWEIFGMPGAGHRHDDRRGGPDDLDRHAREIEAHESFNYAIFDADETGAARLRLRRPAGVRGCRRGDLLVGRGRAGGPISRRCSRSRSRCGSRRSGRSTGLATSGATSTWAEWWSGPSERLRVR